VAEARVLISDLTGGEVSPRVDARADLERYARACRLASNVISLQQGGAILRRGTQYLGLASSSGAVPEPAVVLVPWRAGAPGASDLLLEFSGTTVRGWTNAGLVMVSGSPYTVTLPAGITVSARMQWSQRGTLLALTAPDMPPLLMRIDSTTSWTITPVPSSSYPRRAFNDAQSPTRQDSVTELEFIGFSPGNSFALFVNGQVVKEKSFQKRVFSNEPSRFVFTTNTTQMVNLIKEGLLASRELNNPDEVTVAFVSGAKYLVTLSGASGGVSVSAAAYVETSTVRIAVANNANGRDGEEAAWSYPTVVLHSGTYYRCLLAHVSTATTPPAAPTLWEALGGVPAWESIQPSTTWSSLSISYAPGNRGFPAVCCFHQQRLMVGGTPFAPQALWGSAIGEPANFVLGVDDSTALSRDIDAQDAPAIRWMVSQQGLIIGTSAGVWAATAEVALTPADVSLIPLSADRCADRMAVTVGNEVVFISQDRRQLLTVRRNAERGPYETVELSALAEHLARYGLDRLVYCHQPQPVLYAQTDRAGLVLAVTYSRQGDMVAFSRQVLNATVRSLTTLFDATEGDVLWLAMTRPSATSIERLPYAATGAPVDVPDTLATRHLDGWAVRTASGGLATDLLHLGGRTVTILNADGTVQGTGTVTVTTFAYAAVAITDAGFESAGLTNWTVTGTGTVTNSALEARTGTRSLRLVIPPIASSTVLANANYPATAGNTYRARAWWKETVNNGGTLRLVLRFFDAANVLLQALETSFTGGSTSAWTQAEVVGVAPMGASYAKIGVTGSTTFAGRTTYVDDFTLDERAAPTATVPATGSGLVIGEAYVGRLITMEPVVGNPTGPATGRTKRFSDLAVRLYQSALPKVNGDRPSDYAEPGGFRANPGRLRTGEFEVNSAGWGEGAIDIEMDLPHRTEVVAIYGDLKVN
jgi:hypothetical protein